MGLGFGPQDRDLGLKAEIWASRLKYGPGGWGEGGVRRRRRRRKFPIQLNPALTDFRGLTIFFCYRRNSVIANKETKGNCFEGAMNLHLL